ncbi:hypothetical protein JB92DRAFT_3134145 [Gautieria morchelliformis]|nr:hypothetical protein JB92DRAFT_3134145 [Gautieria morchelliformis]
MRTGRAGGDTDATSEECGICVGWTARLARTGGKRSGYTACANSGSECAADDGDGDLAMLGSCAKTSHSLRTLSGLAGLPVLEGMPTLLTGTSHAHDADLSGTCELKGVKRGWRAETDGSSAGSARPGSRRMPRHARYPGAMHADPYGTQSPSKQRGDTNALPRWHLGGVGALGGSGGS